MFISARAWKWLNPIWMSLTSLLLWWQQRKTEKLFSAGFILKSINKASLTHFTQRFKVSNNNQGSTETNASDPRSLTQTWSHVLSVVVFELELWTSLQSLPTVVAHPQALVGRTSRRDCGKRWVGWRQSILSSRSCWLGWHRRLL